VREAHPVDGWSMGKDPLTKDIFQPKNLADRNKVARTCCTALNITMPMVVDDMNDRIGHAYSGMPDRLYVIDAEGRIAYKGGRGPFGFRPAEMEQALAMAILEGILNKSGAKQQP
jgi:Iodothyronine deiodinase